MQIVSNVRKDISIKEKIMTSTEYILGFINSNIVYKHLIDIGYEPDALTAAFIVWQSKDHTLEEKEKAYRFIIENMKDMPIPAHENHRARESLHSFLKKYIRRASRWIERFKRACKRTS